MGRPATKGLPELAVLMKQYKEALAEFPAYLFHPNLKQELFFHPDNPIFPRFRVFQGGNRTGKTEAGCLEALSFALGERPWDGSKTPVKAPCRGRIVGTSYLDGINRVIWPKIQRLFPDSFITKTKTGQQGSIVEVHCANGSWFDLLSGEQDSMKHEGADLDWVWFDEPPSHDHWIANVRGLVDRGGYAWLTMTPLVEPWILDDIVAKHGVDENYYMVQASMYDNVGFGLKEKQVKEFEAQLTEEEKMVRIHGEWLVLQGLIYKEYRDYHWKAEKATLEDWGGHLIEPFEIPNHWTRYCGIDPHERTPTQVTWMAVNEKGQKFVYDELILPNMNVPQMAAEIKLREATQNSPASGEIMRIIDPAAAKQSNVIQVGMNIKDEFMKAGIYTYPAINDIDAGHKKVKEGLIVRESLSGVMPDLFVFDDCVSLRKSFTRYIWEEWKGPTKDEKYPKEKPRDNYKHPVDTLRYILMANPIYIAPRRSQGEDQTTRAGYYG